MEQTFYYETQQTLLKLIEEKRMEMQLSAKYYGMKNEKTLKLSQELDELILVYQKADSDPLKQPIAKYEGNLTEQAGDQFLTI